MPKNDQPPPLPQLDEVTPVERAAEAPAPIRALLRALLVEHRENARATLVALGDLKKQLRVVSDSVGYLRLRKNLPESLWKPLRVVAWFVVANLAVLLVRQLWLVVR